MRLYFLRSQAEYGAFLKVEEDRLASHLKYVRRQIPEVDKEFTINGYSYTAKKQVDFRCDFRYSSGFPMVNWRERMCCPVTGFNTRTRFSIHLIDSHLGLFSNSNIYIMEQVTPLYGYLSGIYNNTIGSEYIGDEVPLGTTNSLNIRNEDSTALTFPTEHFNAVLSYDVFEHIPDFRAAFKECYRVLRKEGTMLFSVPFDTGSEKNLIRASLDNEGNILHKKEPEYHGDPIGSGKGVLCFQYFGWELLDDLKESGFRDAYAVIGWSEEFCYFTPQIQFVARK